MSRNSDLRDLRLRDYLPRPQVILPEHEIVRASTPAIDAHTHLGKWLSSWADMEGLWLVDKVHEWLERMEPFGVLGFVNLDGRWGAELDANLQRFDGTHPGKFATFAHLDWSVFETRPAKATDILVGQVESARAAGAAGFKVWKDLGLTVRDAHGDVLLPDDRKLDDVWSAIGEAELPVWWHIADPTAFFAPIDEHNEYVEMLCDTPEWSFHGDQFPSFDRLMACFEHVIGSHPFTNFVGVHAGCYAENLNWVDRMLTAYENFHIDISARISQLGRQPRATRDLFVHHPDRILFGTDQIPPTGEAYPTYFRFLETADECFSHSPDPADVSMGRWQISALDLPVEILPALYGENAARLIPRLDVLKTGHSSTRGRA